MSERHHGIMEVKRFVDEQGREVLQFSQMFGKDDTKSEPFYKGRAMVRVQPMAPNGVPLPPQSVPFEFLFPEGTGLKRAFDTFDEVAKREVEEHAKKMKEQAAANRVVGATMMPPILGADGKPAKA